MDFTITKYTQLLKSLQSAGFFFQTFSDFLASPIAIGSKDKVVILRHDVDLLPANSLVFAQIQADNGIKGSYYFRAVPESWDENIIKEIAGMGHEVGYHYENMDVAFGKAKETSIKAKIEKGSKEYEKLLDHAYQDFCENLEKLRKLVSVSTICMHGSPRSQFDNKAIWEKYDYKSLGIIGEPYYDIDFDKVFYLTDTGRQWDGWKVSIRDKVPQQEEWNKQGLVFHSTNDIIKATELGQLPDKVMFTLHPQRWLDKSFPWFKELVMQNLKNQVKRLMIARSGSGEG
ncbi:hypothetical protein ACFLQ5_00450 [Bacteroidota bacterium]